MIKALIYSDLQATEGHERCFNNPSLPLQRWRVQQFYQNLRRLYDKHQCNAVWDLGDTTDDRHAIPIPTLNAIQDGLDLIPDSAFNLKVIGNHEQYTRSTSVHCGCLFSKKFKVVEEFQLFGFEGVNVIAFSYPNAGDETSVQAKIAEALSFEADGRKIVVLGHLEIAGCQMKSGVNLAGTDAKLFSKADLVLLGHIHQPQQLSSNIHYVGSPFQQNYGEAGEPKRLGLLTIEDGQFNMEWLPSEGYPTYRRVSWPEFATAYKPSSEDRYTVTLGSPEEAESLYSHPGASRVRVEYAYQVETSSAIEAGTEVVQAWDIQSSVQRWVKKMPPSEKQITVNAEELAQFGLQLASA